MPENETAKASLPFFAISLESKLFVYFDRVDMTLMKAYLQEIGNERHSCQSGSNYLNQKSGSM